MKRISLFGWIGAGAVLVIVVASIVVRTSSLGDAAADVGEQRAAVERFDNLVRSGQWTQVFALTTEPPTRDPARFAALMRKQVKKHGAISAIRIESLRLIRSRTAPLLEAREVVSLVSGDTQHTVSYFARRGNRWLFAFSAPA